ncbi:hypothetical protein BN6_20000 [Saccharothrix espanaensis DSM 44229]|uniref:Uncharacterized protein n=1 Tax=Saccharothrix espanaensis (strain ATCC 51144 / DSM 44229 / JCM 9112 / NBRC 15066 / NRRL 15764) TaxID=1179773 RepID=K0JTR3_SACES|nr:hypothetical protein BN6_20000 [Saccharothrix espanaensis DSM 44229]
MGRRTRLRAVNRAELEFIARITRANTLLGRYCARLMDEADPLCTTEYTVPLHNIERDLSREVIELGDLIGRRAEARLHGVDGVDVHRELPE